MKNYGLIIAIFALCLLQAGCLIESNNSSTEISESTKTDSQMGLIVEKLDELTVNLNELNKADFSYSPDSNRVKVKINQLSGTLEELSKDLNSANLFPFIEKGELNGLDLRLNKVYEDFRNLDSMIFALQSETDILANKIDLNLKNNSLTISASLKTKLQRISNYFRNCPSSIRSRSKSALKEKIEAVVQFHYNLHITRLYGNILEQVTTEERRNNPSSTVSENDLRSRAQLIYEAQIKNPNLNQDVRRTFSISVPNYLKLTRFYP